MSEFQATGNLVVESIENQAADDLQDSFAISASSAVKSGGRPSKAVDSMTDHLDRSVELAEERNDLLRNLSEAQQDNTVTISRALRSLGRLTGAGLAGLGGAVSTLALSESPTSGPQPEPTPGRIPGAPSGDTSESDVVDPVNVTAAALIAKGATVPASEVIASAASVAASNVVDSGASVGVDRVIDTAATIEASDVVTAAVTLSTGNIVAGAVALEATDVAKAIALEPKDVTNTVALGPEDVAKPVTLEVSDVVDAPDVSVSEALGALGLGAVGGGLAAGLSAVESAATSAAGGAAPGAILPKLLTDLNEAVPQDLMPSRTPPGDRRAGESGRRPQASDRRTRVNNRVDVTVNNETELSRREKQNIVDEAVDEVRKSLENGL